MKTAVELSENIVEAILIRLSQESMVDDSLEGISVEAYDKLEDDLCEIVHGFLVNGDD